MSSERSLTQRRRAETQMDIAVAAARALSAERSNEVTVEEIAAEAGVSLRTFYRYFSTKEDAVAPLLTVGADNWQRAIDAAGAEVGSPERLDELRAAITSAIDEVLTPADASARESMEWTKGLIRASQTNPALRSVWLRVNNASEERLRLHFMRLFGGGGDEFLARLLATAATDAVRAGLEQWVVDDESEDAAALAHSAFDRLSLGLFAPSR